MKQQEKRKIKALLMRESRLQEDYNCLEEMELLNQQIITQLIADFIKLSEEKSHLKYLVEKKHGPLRFPLCPTDTALVLRINEEEIEAKVEMEIGQMVKKEEMSSEQRRTEETMEIVLQREQPMREFVVGRFLVLKVDPDELPSPGIRLEVQDQSTGSSSSFERDLGLEIEEGNKKTISPGRFRRTISLLKKKLLSNF